MSSFWTNDLWKKDELVPVEYIDELNKRLEQTIDEFNSDLKSVLDSSFKSYDLKMKKMNDTGP